MQVILMIILIGGIVAGWVMNVVQVVAGLSALPKIADISGILVLKIIGIPFGPLGAILGWIG